MWSIEALNSSRNRAEGGEQRVVGHATGHELTRYGVRKGFGGALSMWMGYMQGYGGEPTIGGNPSDPTSGWGMKAVAAIVGSVGELVQLLFNWHLDGYAGCIVDGAVQATGDAGWYTWAFDFGVMSGTAKLKADKGAAGGAAAAGFDYRRKTLPQPNPMAASGAAVASGVRAAVGDPFAGYR